jgi:hypothetical protein
MAMAFVNVFLVFFFIDGGGGILDGIHHQAKMNLEQCEAQATAYNSRLHARAYCTHVGIGWNWP